MSVVLIVSQHATSRVMPRKARMTILHAYLSAYLKNREASNPLATSKTYAWQPANLLVNNNRPYFFFVCHSSSLSRKAIYAKTASILHRQQNILYGKVSGSDDLPL
ncbi:hypothetical protein KM043_015159 [Ampulex compressa]|nr:hypothetical protein KM043_015159 [Ampulex compressa]